MKKKNQSSDPMAAAVSAPFKGTTNVPQLSELKQAIKVQNDKEKSKSLSPEELIKKYMDLLDLQKEKLKLAIGALTITSASINTVDPKKILQLLRDKEIVGKHRLDVIKLLDEALRIRAYKKTGLCNEEFDEKKHMSNLRSYGPDREFNKKRKEKLNAALKRQDEIAKNKKK